ARQARERSVALPRHARARRSCAEELAAALVRGRGAVVGVGAGLRRAGAALTFAFSPPARTMQRRMTVECPRCGTVYRSRARAERGAAASYRCARCRHVCGASRDEPVMVSEAEEPGDDDEQFAFDEEREDEPAPPAPPAARAPRDPPPRTMSV